MDDVPDYDGVLTLALLYHELSRMESILQLLKMHDEIVNNIESLTNKLHKAEASKSPKVRFVYCHGSLNPRIFSIP